MKELTYQDFVDVELRVGTVVDVQEFPEARKPAWKLFADFGEFGKKWSSAQITGLYTREELMGRQILGVINIGTKNVGAFTSEFLTTGFKDVNGDIVLAGPERLVPNGEKLL